MERVDARGLSCPEPVILARRAIQALPKGGEAEVWVDSVTSRENVLRAARALGCEVRVEDQGGEFRLTARRL